MQTDAKTTRPKFELHALDTIQRITGSMRLARKYDAASVLQRLSYILARDWPNNLESWDAMEQHLEDRRRAVWTSVQALDISYPEPGTPRLHCPSRAISMPAFQLP